MYLLFHLTSGQLISISFKIENIILHGEIFFKKFSANFILNRKQEVLIEMVGVHDIDMHPNNV